MTTWYVMVQTATEIVTVLAMYKMAQTVTRQVTIMSW